MTRPEDLRGEALRQFEVWRNLGLSEAAALDEVRAAGALDDLDEFDKFARVFERLGLSEEAARVAAVGRAGSEFEARESFAAARRELSLMDEVEAAREAVIAVMARPGGIEESVARDIVARNMDGRPLQDQLDHARRYLDKFGGRVRPSVKPVEAAGPRPKGRPARRVVEVTEAGELRWLR